MPRLINTMNEFWWQATVYVYVMRCVFVWFFFWGGGGGGILGRESEECCV